MNIQPQITKDGLISVVLMVMLLLSGCDNPEPLDLPFETIEREDGGKRVGGGPYAYYEGKEPMLIIISKSEDIAKIENIVSSDSQAHLNNLDASTYFALAVFQGLKPTDGYGTEIQRIVQQGNTVTIYVHFTQRDPQIGAADILTSPFHLVKVQETGIQGGIEFILNADDVVIDRQVHSFRQ